MKKYLLSAVLITAFVSQGIAQIKSKLVLPAIQYQQLKEEGKLKPDVEYLPVGDVHPTPISPVTKEHLDNMHYPKMGGPTSCSCLVPIDATFSIAEITIGTPPEYRNDDGSTALKTIPFTFCLYGTNYTTLYINNNGNITFGTALATYTGAAFPSATIPAMVAPFWGDVDTRNLLSGLPYYKITSTYMIVQWKNVGYFNSYADKLNTFQLIITDGTDPILPAGNNIAFCYGDMQWTTGDASGGSGGFGGTASTVGVNKGNGINYIQMGRFDQAGMAYDGGYGANDGVSWLDNQSMYFNVCAATNIAPIASGLNNCDTVHICGTGDTLLLNGLFLAPEIAQTTSVSINLNSTPGATVVSNYSGVVAVATVQIISSALNCGNNVITFTATDNGIPIGVTTINVNVFVDCSALATFVPVISGNTEFCQGGSSVLSVTPTTYDSYSWNTGSTNTTTTVTTSGPYWCTVSDGGCYKTVLENVIVNPLPTPVIAGYPFTCSGGTTLLYADSLIYSSYSWCCPASTNDSVNVSNGTYVLTVVDTNGCTSSSPPINVTGPTPPIITGQTAVCNGANANLTTTFPYVSYVWTPSGIVNDTANVPAGTYTVSVVDINGCNLTSAPFTVLPFNFTLAVSGVQPYCAGQSITLVATASPAAGPTPVYDWNPGISITPTQSVNSGGVYTCTITYPNGCTTDTTFTVPNPNPLPTPVITGPVFTCNGNPTTLGVDSTYVSYSWSNGGTSSTITDTAGSYDVTVTDANGCVGTSPSVTVTNSSPTVTISGNQTFCPGDNIVLVANPTVTGGESYLWSNTAVTQSTTVATPGTYIVNVNYTNGCSTADTVSVNQFNSPFANFSDSPPNTAPPLTTVNFTDLSTVSGSTITGWYWNFGDGSPSSNLQNPNHTYNVDGTYTITLAVQDNNGCWDTIHRSYEVVSTIKVPNVFTPGNGGTTGVNQYFYIDNLEFCPNTLVTIFNRWGSKVYENKNYHNDWNGGSFSDGTYYYIISGPYIKETLYGFVQIIR